VQASAADPGPFFDASGDAVLTECAVLFVDILGVREMATGSDAPQHLVALQRAVRGRVRDFLSPSSPWPARFFSDTLVLAAPIAVHGDEEAAVGGLTIQAAWLQLNLIAEGFFLRGALTVGSLHMAELLFGPALVEAYELESQRAVHPRVVLSERATAGQHDALAYYADPRESPQNALLMRDDDGFTFIDYLALLFDEPIDPIPDLEVHRDAVVDRLQSHRAKRRQ
jgi:hypothetical protein